MPYLRREDGDGRKYFLAKDVRRSLADLCKRFNIAYGNASCEEGFGAELARLTDNLPIVESIGKQNDTALKPKKSDSGEFYICPNCNKFVQRFEQAHGNNEIPYCKWCGQKWDWSEDK